MPPAHTPESDGYRWPWPHADNAVRAPTLGASRSTTGARDPPLAVCPTARAPPLRGPIAALGAIGSAASADWAALRAEPHPVVSRSSIGRWEWHTGPGAVPRVARPAA